MKAQWLEYLDILNILFSERSVTRPQVARINKILAFLEEIPVNLELRNTDVLNMFFDSDIEQHHERNNSLSIP